jgi:uncharacterized protein
MTDLTNNERPAPLQVAWLFLALAFAIPWLLLILGIREKWGEDYLIFGVAGPAIAAMILARKSLSSTRGGIARVIASLGVVLLGWIILLMSRQWRAGTVEPLRWNAWLILPALMPALVCWGALGAEGAKGQWLRSLIVPTNWRWPIIAFFAWPAFLLIPAELFHLAGGRLAMPAGAKLSGAYLATSAVMFAKELLFAGVLEEPGWRGFLLPRLEARYSPLLASVLVWLPWAAWHAPLDFTSWLGHSLMSYVQIRVVYFLVISILMTWLYNRSGRSLLTVVVFHAGFNTFPFVLPYAPPMLALIFLCAIAAIISDRMWKRIDLRGA